MGKGERGTRDTGKGGPQASPVVCSAMNANELRAALSGVHAAPEEGLVREVT